MASPCGICGVTGGHYVSPDAPPLCPAEHPTVQRLVVLLRDAGADLQGLARAVDELYPRKLITSAAHRTVERIDRALADLGGGAHG